jgi:hypothetical protein
MHNLTWEGNNLTSKLVRVRTSAARRVPGQWSGTRVYPGRWKICYPGNTQEIRVLVYISTLYKIFHERIRTYVNMFNNIIVRTSVRTFLLSRIAKNNITVNLKSCYTLYFCVGAVLLKNWNVSF